jgi:hypothetical protein
MLRIIFVAMVGALLLCAMPAVADECQDLTHAKNTLEAQNSEFDVVTGADAEVIENGLTQAGGTVPQADRTFIVFWLRSGKARVAGFISGCFEDAIDLPGKMVSTWIDRQGAVR